MKTILAVAGIFLAWSVTAAAEVEWKCVGTSGLQKVCYHLESDRIGLDYEDPLFHDCVYLGGSSCTNVSVPNAFRDGKNDGDVVGVDCEGIYGDSDGKEDSYQEWCLLDAD